MVVYFSLKIFFKKYYVVKKFILCYVLGKDIALYSFLLGSQQSILILITIMSLQKKSKFKKLLT